MIAGPQENLGRARQKNCQKGVGINTRKSTKKKKKTSYGSDINYLVVQIM